MLFISCISSSVIMRTAWLLVMNELLVLFQLLVMKGPLLEEPFQSISGLLSMISSYPLWLVNVRRYVVLLLPRHRSFVATYSELAASSIKLIGSYGFFSSCLLFPRSSTLKSSPPSTPQHNNLSPCFSFAIPQHSIRLFHTARLTLDQFRSISAHNLDFIMRSDPILCSKSFGDTHCSWCTIADPTTHVPWIALGVHAVEQCRNGKGA